MQHFLVIQNDEIFEIEHWIKKSKPLVKLKIILRFKTFIVKLQHSIWKNLNFISIFTILTELYVYQQGLGNL